MFDTLIEFFLSRPARLVNAGRALFQIGATLIGAGLCGRVATAGLTAIQSISGRVASDSTLAALYPSLPTWWVPENALGYCSCSLVALAGLLLIQFGRTLRRAIDS